MLIKTMILKQSDTLKVYGIILIDLLNTGKPAEFFKESTHFVWNLLPF